MLKLCGTHGEMARLAMNAREMDQRGRLLLLDSVNQMACSHGGPMVLLLARCKCAHCPLCILEEQLYRKFDFCNALAFAAEARNNELLYKDQLRDNYVRVKWAASLNTLAEIGGIQTEN